MGMGHSGPFKFHELGSAILNASLMRKEVNKQVAETKKIAKMYKITRRLDSVSMFLGFVLGFL